MIGSAEIGRVEVEKVAMPVGHAAGAGSGSVLHPPTLAAFGGMDESAHLHMPFAKCGFGKLAVRGMDAAFETNLEARAEPRGISVIVTPTSASNRDVIRRTVADALSMLAEHITVTVKPG